MCDIASKMNISGFVGEFDPVKMVKNIMDEFEGSSLPLYQMQAIDREISRYASISFKRIPSYHPACKESPPFFVMGKIKCRTNEIGLDCMINGAKEHIMKPKKAMVAEIIGCLAHELAHLAQRVNSPFLFGGEYDTKDRKKYMNYPIEVDAFAAAAAVELAVDESLTLNIIMKDSNVTEKSRDLFYCRLGMWRNVLAGGEYIPLDKHL